MLNTLRLLLFLKLKLFQICSVFSPSVVALAPMFFSRFRVVPVRRDRMSHSLSLIQQEIPTPNTFLYECTDGQCLNLGEHDMRIRSHHCHRNAAAGHCSAVQVLKMNIGETRCLA